MKWRSILAGIALAANLAVLMAPAGAAAPIRARLRHQRHRIGFGVRRGALTPREARQLRRRERRLARQNQRARMSGGGMTWREHRRMERRMNRQSRRIYRRTHNRMRR